MDNRKTEDAAKAALAAKRKAKAETDAAMTAKIDADRRDVPPGIEVTEAEERGGTVARACAAFVRAQSEFEPVTFDRENPHYKSRYASLTAILRATLPALNRNKIALTSRTRVVGEWIFVRTCLVYDGVPFVTSAWPVGKLSTPPQQLGSALTYARRYSIQSILGVAAEEDDDGNAAQGAKPPVDPF